MTFKYEYVPEEQLKSNSEVILLSAGEAEFFISEIFETDRNGNLRFTQSGLPKITFKLKCVDCRGRVGTIYQDISSKMQWVFIAIGKSIGRKIYNETGTTNWKSLVGLSGKCILENKNNPGYDIKTSIKQYIPIDYSIEDNVQSTIEDEEDLPF